MGISYSRFFQELRMDKQSEEKPEIDPRSPTLHISRTPMSALQKQSHNKITKAQDLTTDIETPLSGSYETLYPRSKQLEQLRVETQPLDPRSPSQGIQRTPLTLVAGDDEAVPEPDVQISEDPESAESFESALSKLDFNSSFEDEKKLLETNFDYNPPESAPIENTIDPRSPGIERTPFVFDDEENQEVQKECENSTPKSVLTVFQDENAGQRPTPKQGVVVQEGVRTPLSCLANRMHSKPVLKGSNDTENCPVSAFSSAKGKRNNSRIPLPKRCIEN